MVGRGYQPRPGLQALESQVVRLTGRAVASMVQAPFTEWMDRQTALVSFCPFKEAACGQRNKRKRSKLIMGWRGARWGLGRPELWRA